MKNSPGNLENDHNINERILYMSFDLGARVKSTFGF